MKVPPILGVQNWGYISEWPLRGGSVFCEQYELSSQLPLAIFIICRWGEKSSCLGKSSFLLNKNGSAEAASYGQLPRVAAPSVYFGPWAGLISCWPRPQQLLPVSAAGSRVVFAAFSSPLCKGLKKQNTALASLPFICHWQRSAPLQSSLLHLLNWGASLGRLRRPRDA